MMTSHASDCALHNAPALPVRPCDCGAGDLPRVIRKLRAALKAKPNCALRVRHHDIRVLLEAVEQLTRQEE